MKSSASPGAGSARPASAFGVSERGREQGGSPTHRARRSRKAVVRAVAASAERAKFAKNGMSLGAMASQVERGAPIGSASDDIRAMVSPVRAPRLRRRASGQSPLSGAGNASLQSPASAPVLRTLPPSALKGTADVSEFSGSYAARRAVAQREAAEAKRREAASRRRQQAASEEAHEHLEREIEERIRAEQEWEADKARYVEEAQRRRRCEREARRRCVRAVLFGGDSPPPDGKAGATGQRGVSLSRSPHGAAESRHWGQGQRDSLDGSPAAGQSSPDGSTSTGPRPSRLARPRLAPDAPSVGGGDSTAEGPRIDPGGSGPRATQASQTAFDRLVRGSLPPALMKPARGGGGGGGGGGSMLNRSSISIVPDEVLALQQECGGEVPLGQRLVMGSRVVLQSFDSGGYLAADRHGSFFVASKPYKSCIFTLTSLRDGERNHELSLGDSFWLQVQESAISNNVMKPLHEGEGFFLGTSLMSHVADLEVDMDHTAPSFAQESHSRVRQWARQQRDQHMGPKPAGSAGQDRPPEWPQGKKGLATAYAFAAGRASQTQLRAAAHMVLGSDGRGQQREGGGGPSSPTSLRRRSLQGGSRPSSVASDGSSSGAEHDEFGSMEWAGGGGRAGVPTAHSGSAGMDATGSEAGSEASSSHAFGSGGGGRSRRRRAGRRKRRGPTGQELRQRMADSSERVADSQRELEQTMARLAAGSSHGAATGVVGAGAGDKGDQLLRRALHRHSSGEAASALQTRLRLADELLEEKRQRDAKEAGKEGEASSKPSGLAAAPALGGGGGGGDGSGQGAGTRSAGTMPVMRKLVPTRAVLMEGGVNPNKAMEANTQATLSALWVMQPPCLWTPEIALVRSGALTGPVRPLRGPHAAVGAVESEDAEGEGKGEGEGEGSPSSPPTAATRGSATRSKTRGGSQPKEVREVDVLRVLGPGAGREPQVLGAGIIRKELAKAAKIAAARREEEYYVRMRQARMGGRSRAAEEEEEEAVDGGPSVKSPWVRRHKMQSRYIVEGRAGEEKGRGAHSSSSFGSAGAGESSGSGAGAGAGSNGSAQGGDETATLMQMLRNGDVVSMEQNGFLLSGNGASSHTPSVLTLPHTPPGVTVPLPTLQRLRQLGTLTTRWVIHVIMPPPRRKGNQGPAAATLPLGNRHGPKAAPAVQSQTAQVRDAALEAMLGWTGAETDDMAAAALEAMDKMAEEKVALEAESAAEQERARRKMPRRAAAVSKSVEARRDDMIRYKALTRLAESEARRDARTALQDQLRRTRVEALHDANTAFAEHEAGRESHLRDYYEGQASHAEPRW